MRWLYTFSGAVAANSIGLLERTCHMRDQGLPTLCVLALVIAITPVTPVDGQAQTSTSQKTTAAGKTAWTQPRTQWGDPDLQGIICNYATITPLGRPGASGYKDLPTHHTAAEP